MKKGTKKIVGEVRVDVEGFTKELQREKAASSLALLRATARRFSVAQRGVEDLGEIAASSLKRIQEADHAIEQHLTKDTVRGSTATYLAGGHTQVALILARFGRAKTLYDFIYGELREVFQAAEGLTSHKEAQKALSEEFDGRPPPIEKTEFRVAS